MQLKAECLLSRQAQLFAHVQGRHLYVAQIILYRAQPRVRGSDCLCTGYPPVRQAELLATPPSSPAPNLIRIARVRTTDIKLN